MTQQTSIQTHDAQNVTITKNDYTDDDTTARAKDVTVTIETEDDTMSITAHGDEDLTLEVVE